MSQVKDGRQPDLPLYQKRPTSPTSRSTQLHGYQRPDRARVQGLRGLRQEPGAALYITGIAVDNESDEEIGEMVKEYLRQNGVCVMKYKVIRLRAVYDVVGCRIIVPQSQEHVPLNPDIWPDQYVKCRRWERAEVYHRNNKNSDYENDWANNTDYTGHRRY